MNKRVLCLGFVIAFTLSQMTTPVFAQTQGAETKTSLDTAEKIKVELNDCLTDGIINQTEKETLKESATEEAIAALIEEKLEVFESMMEDSDHLQLAMGEEEAVYTYDLGDGCSVIIKLSDKEENSTSVNSNQVSERATSGSNTLWKGYGDRYFTASATVDFVLGTARMDLENHYTLSSKGIDERYGTPFCSASHIKTSVTSADPVISDSTARTVGESDVDMYCNYTVKAGSNAAVKYKLSTTVGFVAINKTEEKIKVKQSWKLTKIS